VKAQISNGRLYVIGGGNRNTGPFQLTDFHEYFDFKTQKWERFGAGTLKAFNFQVIPSSKAGQLIIYGGSEDASNDNQLRKFYFFDTAKNEVISKHDITH